MYALLIVFFVGGDVIAAPVQDIDACAAYARILIAETQKETGAQVVRKVRCQNMHGAFVFEDGQAHAH